MATSLRNQDRVPEPPHARRPWTLMWLAFAIVAVVLTVWGFVRAGHP